MICVISLASNLLASKLKGTLMPKSNALNNSAKHKLILIINLMCIGGDNRRNHRDIEIEGLGTACKNYENLHEFETSLRNLR